MFYRQYYSELGKLLYAISASDGSISPKEKETLKALVRKELLPAEKHIDKFGTDAAYYVEIEFDILEDSSPDVESTFESFLDFIEAHRTAIDPNMRTTTLKIAERLADAFHKTNQKEKALIKKLKSKFESLELKPQHA